MKRKYVRPLWGRERRDFMCRDRHRNRGVEQLDLLQRSVRLGMAGTWHWSKRLDGKESSVPLVGQRRLLNGKGGECGYDSLPWLPQALFSAPLCP
jgi:hypothetical protein